MAISIIKEPENKKTTVTCPVCGCEFEFDIQDAEWESTYGGYLVYHVRCPYCKFDVKGHKGFNGTEH